MIRRLSGGSKGIASSCSASQSVRFAASAQLWCSSSQCFHSAGESISDRSVLRCNMLRSINAYMQSMPARRRWRWRWRCWRWHSPQSLSPSIRCGLPLSSRPSNAESGRSLAAAASAPIARKRVEEAHRAFTRGQAEFDFDAIIELGSIHSHY